MINLTPRLRAVVGQVLPCESAVDVGCDHAQVGIYLVQNKVVHNMTVSDINDGPIQRAKESVDRVGLADKIRCIKTDGLSGIAPCDCVIIAGMGGELISDILRCAEWTKKGARLILQPMTAGEKLREFLFENGYTIISENIARERDKLYIIITAQGGKTENYTKADLYLSDLTSPLAQEFLNKEIIRITSAMRGMECADKPNTEKIHDLKELVSELESRVKL